MFSATYTLNNSIWIPFESPKTGSPIVTQYAYEPAGSLAKLPLVCPVGPEYFPGEFRQELLQTCEGPHIKNPSPATDNPKLIWWVACRHGDHWVNCIVNARDGRLFHVGVRPSNYSTSQSELWLFELQPKLVQHWAESQFLDIGRRPQVQRFLSTNRVDPMFATQIPEFAVEVPGDPIVGGSTTLDGHLIRISPWILHSTEEARSVLRHETAHRLVALANLPGNAEHGPSFQTALAAVSDTPDNDQYWWPRQEIEMARQRMHPGCKPLDVFPAGPLVKYRCGVGSE